jgi:hypothetical protein
VSPVTHPGHERLSDRQYVVLSLRLLVDAESAIVYGDAGGPEAHNPTVERLGSLSRTGRIARSGARVAVAGAELNTNLVRERKPAPAYRRSCGS